MGWTVAQMARRAVELHHGPRGVVAEEHLM